MKIILTSFAVILLCVCAAIGLVLLMPSKSTWADDYRQYASTLASDDPLHQTLNPMLADGELSIWEISQIHCGKARGCQLNNFAEVLMSPQSADIFAQTVLVTLKPRIEL